MIELTLCLAAVSDVAPFAASVAALAISGVTAWVAVWRRPVLELRFDPESHPEDISRLSLDDGTDVRRVRVRVHNKSGRRTAENAEVLVTELRSESGIRSGPVSTRTLRWTHYRPTDRLNIAPGAFRYLDLLKTSTGAGPNGEQLRTHLQMFPTPKDADRYELQPGRHVATVAVTTQEATARFYAIMIEVKKAAPSQLASAGPIATVLSIARVFP